MSRRTTTGAIIGVLVVLLLVAGIFVGRRLRDTTPDFEIGAPSAQSLPKESDSIVPRGPFLVDLYFPAGGSVLYPESRELGVGEEVEARIRGIIEAILAGPESSNLNAPLPSSVALSGVYLLDGARVVLDFGSADDQPPAAGSQREIMTVYSLVNSVLLNLDGLESVVLMWNGEQRTTFSGHLDTTRPLYPRPEMVARRQPPTVSVTGTN